MNSSLSKWLYALGVFSIAFVLLSNMISIGRQAPWEDEIFAVSTGWSIAHSRPPILSVLAQYPQTGSPVRFYGPVSFEAEALLIRIFGLSFTVWRLACFAGVVLSLWVSWLLVKVAGGDKWARLITTLFIALAGSVGGPLPGRWDAVTSGLFFCGLLFFLRSAEYGGRAMAWRAALAGLPIGFALASSPRALTLAMAALVASFLVAVWFRRHWKGFLLGSLGMFSVAVLVQTLLLWPWGLTSISWYSSLKGATREDSINATPLAGRGSWNLDLYHHKTLAILFISLLLISLYSAITQRKYRAYSARTPLKAFVTFFAVGNLALMLLLLANALGAAVFWLPPAVAALTCWVDWEFRQDRRIAVIAVSLLSICLLVLLFQETEQMTSVILTWNRRSTTALTAFVEATLPKEAVVYGPVGGYFYPVELSGRQYLYAYEHTTPGLYSEPPGSASGKLDLEICAHPTYAMWPKPNPAHQPQEEPMPEAVRERLLPRVGEFNQPPIAPWREKLLDNLGPIAGKYGFPDATIYPLRSLNACGKD